MVYLKFGDSKNYIVFLHGWGADKNSFLWLKNFFSDHSLIFLDFAGFGMSPQPSKPYYVSDYVSDLKCLMDEFEIENLTIVGHSFGGRVAIKFASLYQNDYKSFRLCLVDSAGVLPRRGLMYYLKIHHYKYLKRKAENSPAIKNKIETMGSSDYQKLTGVMKQTFVQVVNEDLLPVAKHILADTILIWGERDKETKIYMAKKLNRAIKGSKLYVIKNAGHFCFLDMRTDFLILLDTFIKN